MWRLARAKVLVSEICRFEGDEEERKRLVYEGIVFYTFGSSCSFFDVHVSSKNEYHQCENSRILIFSQILQMRVQKPVTDVMQMLYELRDYIT